MMVIFLSWDQLLRRCHERVVQRQRSRRARRGSAPGTRGEDRVQQYPLVPPVAGLSAFRSLRTAGRRTTNEQATDEPDTPDTRNLSGLTSDGPVPTEMWQDFSAHNTQRGDVTAVVWGAPGAPPAKAGESTGTAVSPSSAAGAVDAEALTRGRRADAPLVQQCDLVFPLPDQDGDGDGHGHGDTKAKQQVRGWQVGKHDRPHCSNDIADRYCSTGHSSSYEIGQGLAG